MSQPIERRSAHTPSTSSSCLAQAQHQAAFGRDLWSPPFNPCEEIEAPLVNRVSPHAVIEPRHRFDIVVEDVRLRFDHPVDRRHVAQEIGCENLDGRPGPLPDTLHTLIEMIGPAVRQIIARDRRDDDMRQAEPRGRFGHASRFVGLRALRSFPWGPNRTRRDACRRSPGS